MAEVVLLARRTESGENDKKKEGCGEQEAGKAVILTKVASCQRLRPAPACMHMVVQEPPVMIAGEDHNQ